MSKKANKSKAPAKSKPVAKQAAKPAVVKVTAEAREVQNGITRPGADTLCAKVWEAIEKLRAKSEDVTFDAVRELAGKGMADATIRTQVQRHREFHGIKREVKKPTRKAVAKDAAPAAVKEEGLPVT